MCQMHQDGWFSKIWSQILKLAPGHFLVVWLVNVLLEYYIKNEW